MPRSSGTFNPPSSSWNPPVNGSPATQTDWLVLLADLASGLSQSVSKDGQTTMTGNLPMGANKLTGLAAGTAAGDSIAMGQAGGIVATPAANDRSTLIATTAFVNPANSFASSGYQKFAGGLIIQWTQVNSSSSGVTVVWPIVFPNAVFAVTGISRNSADALWANTVAFGGCAFYTSSATVTACYVIAIGN